MPLSSSSPKSAMTSETTPPPTSNSVTTTEIPKMTFTEAPPTDVEVPSSEEVPSHEAPPSETSHLQPTLNPEDRNYRPSMTCKQYDPTDWCYIPKPRSGGSSPDRWKNTNFKLVTPASSPRPSRSPSPRPSSDASGDRGRQAS